MIIRVLILLVLLGACSGGGMSLSVEIAGCTAKMSWTVPTQRVNGAPFTKDEIQYFDLFIGVASDMYYREIRVADPTLRKWDEPNIRSGLNYFTMTLTDTQDIESGRAVSESKTAGTQCIGG